MAVGFPTKANWAAGDILTAAQMDDLAGTLNTVQAPLGNAAGKNAIINGAFTVSQRGTTFSSPTSGTYNVDRVLCAWDGTGATRTFSQQTQTPGAISGVETPYFYRWNQSVAGSSGTFNLMTTLIEGVQTFAGQSVTFSFYAKAASNLSLVAADINQNFGSGGSTAVTNTMTLSTTSVTTAWTRITATVTLASITGKTIGTGSSIQIRLWLPNNAAFTFDTVGWQLEAGSVATNFQTATGTLQGELSACQRYWSQSYDPGVAAGTVTNANNEEYWYSVAYSTPGDGRRSVNYPVTMRTGPTTTIYSPNTGASGKWYNEATAADVTPAVQQGGTGRFIIYGNGGTINAKNNVLFHWTANAEL